MKRSFSGVPKSNSGGGSRSNLNNDSGNNGTAKPPRPSYGGTGQHTGQHRRNVPNPRKRVRTGPNSSVDAPVTTTTTNSNNRNSNNDNNEKNLNRLRGSSGIQNPRHSLSRVLSKGNNNNNGNSNNSGKGINHVQYEIEIEKLQKQLSMYQKKCNDNETELINFRNRFTNQNRVITDLRERCEKLIKENENLTNDNKKMMNEYQSREESLNKQIDTLMTDKYNLKQELTELTSNLETTKNEFDLKYNDLQTKYDLTHQILNDNNEEITRLQKVNDELNHRLNNIDNEPTAKTPKKSRQLIEQLRQELKQQKENVKTMAMAETESMRNEFSRKMRDLKEENEILTENNNKLLQMEEDYIILKEQFVSLQKECDSLSTEKVHLVDGNENFRGLMRQLRKIFPECDGNDYEIMNNIDKIQMKIIESIRAKDESNKELQISNLKIEELKKEMASQRQEINELNEKYRQLMEQHSQQNIQLMTLQNAKQCTNNNSNNNDNKKNNNNMNKNINKKKRKNSGISKSQGIDLTGDDDDEEEEDDDMNGKRKKFGKDEIDNENDNLNQDNSVEAGFMAANNHLLNYNKKLREKNKEMEDEIILKNKEIDKKNMKIELLQDKLAELDDKVGKGDYDPSETQIVHFKMNPLTVDSSKYRKEQIRSLAQLKKENELLKNKIQSYKQVLTSSSKLKRRNNKQNENENNNENYNNDNDNNNNNNNNENENENDDEIDLIVTSHGNANGNGSETSSINGMNGKMDSKCQNCLILELKNKELLDKIDFLEHKVKTSTEQVNDLEKEVEKQNKIQQKMKSLFSDIASQFRENVCTVLGYRISVSKDRKTYTLKHIWMANSSDSIVLQIDKSNRFSIMETDFVKQYPQLLKKLETNRSLPMFCAEITANLYNEETMSA